MIIFQPPPPTNRGVVSPCPPASNHLPDAPKTLSVSLHWLTATSQAVSVVDAVSFISDYLGHMPEHQEFGLFGYTSTWEWVGGLKLFDNEKRPEMGICLYAPGDTCEHHGFDRLSYIYQSLQFTATRVDLAADNCPFEPSKLYYHWKRDHVRTQARPMKTAQPKRAHLRTHNWLSSPDGDTLYMGSRASTQFARCYNSRGATRFEMELKKERASQVMEALNSGAHMASVFGSVVRQFCAFVKLDDEKRERCTHLPFWAKFDRMLDDAELVTRLDPRPERTIERLVDWIEGQVAPSLAVYEMVKGVSDSFDDVRRHLRKVGLDRATPKHHALVAAAGGWHTQANRRFQISTASLGER